MRQALAKIDELLAQYFNSVEHDEQLIVEAHSVAVTVLDQSKSNNYNRSDTSWEANPDRSGGQFTDAEVLESQLGRLRW